MKKPTRQDTINLRVYRHDGSIVYENIVGIVSYPLAIHRRTIEFEEIQAGSRTRYSSDWNVTHIPTGKGFGITSSNWDAIATYVESIKDEPALLMVTDKTMTNHPCYQQLNERHNELRAKLF